MERGLRQGDPLSSFLFLIVAEALQVMIIEACNKGIFKALLLGRCSSNISLLQLADDALFFGEWSKSNVRHLIHILDCFHDVSGLKINLDKSRLFGIGVSPEEVSSIARSVNCSHGSLPFIYLGLPVGRSMKKSTLEMKWSTNLLEEPHVKDATLDTGQILLEDALIRAECVDLIPRLLSVYSNKWYQELGFEGSLDSSSTNVRSSSAIKFWAAMRVLGFEGLSKLGCSSQAFFKVRIKALLEQQGLAAGGITCSHNCGIPDNVIRKKIPKHWILCLFGDWVLTGGLQGDDYNGVVKKDSDTYRLLDTAIRLENGLLATLNSRELQKMTEAKGDGGEGLYVRRRSGQRDMEQGGSYHITYMIDYLVDLEEYDGGNILIGDGRDAVYGETCKVQVQMRDGSSFVLEHRNMRQLITIYPGCEWSGCAGIH
ncbi:arginine repressor C-terminal-like domain-containing protein [Tanacetum coccineum]|uniref:Arginine repressor C-terminal-like domain-containing protein n=1 Tax=Tanacetum coccineum TaxID=301880 RepID=A0ABQ5B1R0_9ASTR